MRGRDLGERPHRIQDPGGGFAVHDRDVGDPRICCQRLIEDKWIARRVLGCVQNRPGGAQPLADAGHARAVGAVAQDQHLAPGRHEASQHRFDYEGAAALKRYAYMGIPPVNDVDQAFTHAAVHLDEATVARAIVVEHGLLDGRRGGQGAGGQQPGIAGRRCGGRWTHGSGLCARGSDGCVR